MWSDPWPSQTLANLDYSLKTVVGLVDKPERDQPDEVTRALARFLVIRASGYLEQVVNESLSAYILSKSAPRVHAYGISWLGRGNNPSPGNLVALTRKFDGIWADELQALFERDDQRLTREIALLVDRRNKIAHGLNEGVTSRKALDLTACVREISEWFVNRFDPRDQQS